MDAAKKGLGDVSTKNLEGDGAGSITIYDGKDKAGYLYRMIDN